MSPPTRRLDQWLWFARLTKTRALASKLCEQGKVRLERGAGQPVRVDRAHQPVQPGDRLSLVVHERALALEVLDIGARRGPASEAQSLYRDLSADTVNTQAGSHRGATPG